MSYQYIDMQEHDKFFLQLSKSAQRVWIILCSEMNENNRVNSTQIRMAEKHGIRKEEFSKSMSEIKSLIGVKVFSQGRYFVNPNFRAKLAGAGRKRILELWDKSNGLEQ